MQTKTEEVVNEAIGLTLRKFRKALNASQETVGVILGLNQSNVSRIESGRQRLTVSDLMFFCQSVSIPPQKFVEALAVTMQEISNES